MTNQEYYGEVLDSIPFSLSVNLMKQMLPAPLAYGIAGYFRLRHYLGIPTKPKYGFGPLGTSTVLPADQMPPRPMSRWAAKLEKLSDLGFRRIAFSVPDLIGAKESATALLLDESGSTFAVLEWMRMEGANGIEEQVPVEFDSYLMNGSEVMTGLVREEHLAIAGAFKMDFVDQLFLADDMSLKRGYESHLERIKKLQPMHFTPVNAKSEHEQHSLRRFNYLEELGILRKLTDREVAYVKQQRMPQ